MQNPTKIQTPRTPMRGIQLRPGQELDIELAKGQTYKAPKGVKVTLNYTLKDTTHYKARNTSGQEAVIEIHSPKGTPIPSPKTTSPAPAEEQSLF